MSEQGLDIREILGHRSTQVRQALAQLLDRLAKTGKDRGQLIVGLAHAPADVDRQSLDEAKGQRTASVE